MANMIKLESGSEQPPLSKTNTKPSEVRDGVSPVHTKTKPSSEAPRNEVLWGGSRAGSFWRGGATKRARNQACEVPRHSEVRDDDGQLRAAGRIFKFLAFLLAFTLIARGTNSATLARVDTSVPSRATITDTVTGSATVSSRDTQDISAPEGLTIIEMIVGDGQRVEYGDALARFDKDEVRERFERESANLEKMLLDLEKLERKDATDASPLEAADRNLLRAQEDYENTRATEAASVAAAREALNEAIEEAAADSDTSALATALRNLQRACDDYDSVKTLGDFDMAAAQAALETEIERQTGYVEYSAVEIAERNLQRAQDDYETVKSQGEADIAAAQESLDAAKKSQTSYVEYSVVESAHRSLQRAREDYDTVKSQGEADVAAAQAALEALEAANGDSGNAVDDGDSDEIARARAVLATAQIKAAENLLAANRRVEDAEATFSKAENDYYNSWQQSTETRKAEIDRAQSALESAQNRASENLLASMRRIEDAVAALDKAESEYSRALQQSVETRLTEIERAQSSLEATQKKADENLLSALRRVEDAEAALSKVEYDLDNMSSEVNKARSALESAQKRMDENLLSARRRVEDAEISLQKAEQEFDRSEQLTFDGAAQNSLSAISLKLDIDAQKSVVGALEVLMVNDCVFLSDLDGVVSSAMTEGSKTDKTPLVTFRDNAKGYEAQMKIKKTNSDKLKIGDECEVTTGSGSMYYNPTVSGIVSMVSQPDENDSVTVVIHLPGNDWTEGQRVEAQVIIDSGNYDTCVPLSALRSDNTGYYLLTVEQQSSVLGLQNIVTRVSVTIVASDGDMVSVRGPVDRNSQVIIGSNKSITAGDRVRIN